MKQKTFLAALLKVQFWAKALSGYVTFIHGSKTRSVNIDIRCLGTSMPAGSLQTFEHQWEQILKSDELVFKEN